jgi:putative restriction endonuclease
MRNGSGRIAYDSPVLDETKTRLDAIHFVRSLRERWVAVPASELRRFRIHLKGQSGIFKPAELTAPISITTTIDSDHAQDTIEGSRVLYDYVSREHENEALKRAADSELPLIYFLQMTRRPSPEYIVFAPVYVVGWDDDARCFLVDLSEQKPGEVVSPAPVVRQLQLPAMRRPDSPSEIRELTKSYAVTTVQRRLYDARFRNAVLDAYRDRCAVCGLHVRALLDAARVVPDRDPHPDIDVREGIALCATHHRAFDANILRYDDEYVIHIDLGDRPGEGEQAMLVAYDGKRLFLPLDENVWPRR